MWLAWQQFIMRSTHALKVTQTVLEQAEVLSQAWAVA